ncbi:hypothetical protein EYB25_008606 [Talaromyces marneffei]|uniref:HAUS augmin-like complex subunit 6 N-terminal domain-containing protein n=2 Tax=Talaromyces marneffei TaxID=37727 RepID=B6QPC6_TALMQ|nr:uncharacterized protein EYB26_003687 [Talaromyces marneffei]EEA21145.1 conserved hypothetical protein [Talaromyces marneffei ATCC 18224]KAE8550075.1 hypothetical protein EYB25_008606 [Talaromyces marneffei]QGA16020.1 hypothetical protein EYB26_003687 [Talaromyces marneffei]
MQTPCSTTPSWSAPSPVTIFLRNVHLLQLDQQPDWPGLSRKLFSGGQKTQTQRVKSVEWVLYQLFLLWDPSETKNKLRPFFPPLEPLQSINLRAALFRALSDLKKNGYLGRETTVRKTMLDDCKGPKFEEVLAVFSTAVLRKVICESQREPGLRLAFTKSLTDIELEEQLVPLIIAHHASLSNTRQEQFIIRESHDHFSKLLDEKARELSLRSKRKPRQAEESPHLDRLANDVKANWLGGRNLADTLLTGGSTIEKDLFLELSFEKAWSRARKGTMNQLSRSSNADLLQDLDTCLENQRRRLKRLKEFNKSMHREQAGGAVSIKSHGKSQSITFRDHQTLTVASTSKLRDAVESRDLLDEHQAIISSLRDALLEVKGIRLEQDPSRIVTPLVESPRRPDPKQNFTLSPIPDTEQYSPSPSPSVQITDFEAEQRASAFDSTIHDAVSQPSHHNGSQYDSSIREEHGTNPPKANTSHCGFSPDPDSEIDGPPLPRFEPRSLLERTRQSMSLLPPLPTSRSRQSLAARRESQRFPINQFATPPKEQSEPSHSGASTPRDDLFTEEAEYASIFKSRPRVAHSPLMSPAIHVGFEDDDEPGDYVEDDESVLDLALAGSPLASKRR